MDNYELGAVGGMIGMENRSTQREPAPMLFLSTNIPTHMSLPGLESGPPLWEASD
jgi:hypothetical protein